MLFADLSGYTALAESLDPEEVYSFLRPTMLELQRVVESFGGSVPQIQGDGFMAVFGVPTAHEDDAERAVRAALAVRDHVQRVERGTCRFVVPAGARRRELRRGDGGAFRGGIRVHRDGRHGEHRFAHGRSRDRRPRAGRCVDANADGLVDPLRPASHAQGQGEGRADRHVRGPRSPRARPGVCPRGRVRGSGGVLRAVRARAGGNRGGRVFACGGPHGRAGHRQEPARPGARKLTCTRSVPPGPMRPVRRTPAVLARGGRCVRARCGHRHGGRRHTRGDRARGPADRADAPCRR